MSSTLFGFGGWGDGKGGGRDNVHLLPSNFQHALDATVRSLLSQVYNFQHTLDATLFIFSSRFQHTLSATQTNHANLTKELGKIMSLQVLRRNDDGK